MSGLANYIDTELPIKIAILLDHDIPEESAREVHIHITHEGIIIDVLSNLGIAGTSSETFDELVWRLTHETTD